MGNQFLYSRIPYLKSVAINFISSGDNEIVAAQANKRILIHRLFLVCGGSTNLTFKRGSTSLSGAIPMATNGGITFDITGEPWFATDLSEAFNIGSSSGVQVSGTCYYDLSPL